MSWSTTGIALGTNSTDHIRQLLTENDLPMRDLGSSLTPEPRPLTSGGYFVAFLIPSSFQGGAGSGRHTDVGDPNL